MAERFFPFPYRARGLCSGPAEKLCVLELYERAHMNRWAPLRMTVREFAAPGVLRLESAVALLRDLEEAGLLRRQHSETRGRADLVEVFDPLSVEQPVEQETERPDEPPATPKRATPEQPVEHRTEHRAIEEDPRVGDQTQRPDQTPPERDRTTPPTPSTAQVDDQVPRWAKQHTPPPGMHRRDLVAVVVGVKEAVLGVPINPERCGDAARPVLALWRADGERPPDEFLADMRLVVEAAQSCPLPLFARDIRAEGWAGGTDRQRSIATLCVQERWAERLHAAKRWEADGRPSHAADTGPPPARAAPGRSSVTAMLLDEDPAMNPAAAPPRLQLLPHPTPRD